MAQPPSIHFLFPLLATTSGQIRSTTMPTAPKLKGYLPVRIGLPPSVACQFRTSRHNPDRTDTFCFVKEHRSSGVGASGKSSTLFVANCPFVPRVRTSLLLKSIFSRYGDVERATVVRDPRDVAAASALAAASNDAAPDDGDDATATAGAKVTSQPPSSDAAVRLFDDQVELFSDPHHINFVDRNDEGSFGHVVFVSSKDLRLALKALGKLMASGPSEKDGLPPAVTLGALELQELVEASNKLLRKEEAAKYGVPMHGPARQDDSESDSDGGDDDNTGERQKKKKRKVKTGIHALAERQRTLYVKRRFLMEACNAVMEQYEDVEEEAAARARAAAQMPDDDGFVTVVSSKAPAVGADLEEDVIGGGADAGGEGRRKGSKRKRKKKEARGSSELKDFYRFQTKETRRKGLHELRERFEADLAKVKKLKEEKAYRAF